MSEDVYPVRGDTFRSRDLRDEGLTVTVLDVKDGRVYIKRRNKTSLRLDVFYREYEFVFQERGGS